MAGTEFPPWSWLHQPNPHFSLLFRQKKKMKNKKPLQFKKQAKTPVNRWSLRWPWQRVEEHWRRSPYTGVDPLIPASQPCNVGLREGCVWTVTWLM